jgi:hypothetical protein
VSLRGRHVPPPRHPGPARPVASCKEWERKCELHVVSVGLIAFTGNEDDLMLAPVPCDDSEGSPLPLRPLILARTPQKRISPWQNQRARGICARVFAREAGDHRLLSAHSRRCQLRRRGEGSWRCQLLDSSRWTLTSSFAEFLASPRPTRHPPPTPPKHSTSTSRYAALPNPRRGVSDG